MKKKIKYPSQLQLNISIVDAIVLLTTDPSSANSTILHSPHIMQNCTHPDTRPVCFGQPYFWLYQQYESITARQNPLICNPPLYMALVFEIIMQFRLFQLSNKYQIKIKNMYYLQFSSTSLCLSTFSKMFQKLISYLRRCLYDSRIHRICPIYSSKKFNSYQEYFNRKCG